MSKIKIFYFALVLIVGCVSIYALRTAIETTKPVASKKVSLNIDYEAFLGQQDMVWERIPDKWQLAPFTGNGNIGFMFYQGESDKANVISLHTGRHDYYDHRLPHDEQEMLWIYRGRLPLGHFEFESEGKIESVDLKLSLWNAELTGQVYTDKGSYSIRGLTHSNTDIIYFATEAQDGESVKISWHPDVPYPSVRAALDRGEGPTAPNWIAMREAPMPMPPSATLTESGGINYSFQPLYQHRGETTTGWEVIGKPDGKQYLSASIHHSFPEKNSMETVKNTLINARTMLKNEQFFNTHQQWWHDYYPKSYLSIGEPEKEAFYWIQMYKFAAASRGDGPILDLMGPWYYKTFWPMVWGDLNVQLIYWTHLTANRLSLGDSLVNNINKYSENLANNTPLDWKDSAGLGALFPQNMISTIGRGTPDMLAWLLNNYWLQCSYAGDDKCLKEGLFPILRKTANSYLNYLDENPVSADDSKIHIKNSWSPEYEPGHGQDINFTIGLMRWSFQTLLDIDRQFGINDPLAHKWQHIVDNLVEFQLDENGLRIGKNIPFDKPHRHYSHLLPFYPLAILNPENPDEKQLIRTTVDHWLDVTIDSDIKIEAMPVTGYTATGAASIYARLGDADKAYEYLNYFIQHKNVSPTTMYSEGHDYPVIESPLSYATSVHDMLLQSWDGKIRLFPATPEHWKDIAFYHLRTEGAFLVSAKKIRGETEFIQIENLKGKQLIIRSDIAAPNIYVNGVLAKADQAIKDSAGFYHISSVQGDVVTFTALDIAKVDLSVNPTPVKKSKQNMFGLNEKTKRLPGDGYYSSK
jgi:hypothetical protein